VSGSIILWDDPGDPAEATDEVWYWRSFARADRVESIPRYLEDHADGLRAKYLAFIHDLGNHRIGGRRVADHLERPDGFTYWWMTHVAEKSPLKSPRVYCCLRLLALEEMLLSRRPSRLTLSSADRNLVTAVRRLCENLGVAFAWERKWEPADAWSLRRVYQALPFSARGALWLVRHVLQRWRLRRVGSPQWFAGERAACFFSYFIALDPANAAKGDFSSRQWGPLPHLLHERAKQTNWIHHFLFSAAVPSVARAVEWTKGFNHDAERQGVHTFVDSFLGVRVVARAVADWLRLAMQSWRLRKLRDVFYAKDSAAWLWPLLAGDWRTSMRGPVAMMNCLWVALFDKALAGMPTQSRGFYLYEGQGWERAMLHAWRKYGHGEIIGVQHATAPFWHLYYFDDQRTWSDSRRSAMPLPDRLAVNGASPRKAFAAAGFPTDRLVEVEALRYLHLSVAGDEPSVRSRLARDTAGDAFDRRVKILVLGEMVPAMMHNFLQLIERAARQLPPIYEFTLKPHPGYSARLSDYPGLRADETAEPLDRIAQDYDIALAANSTSAACDAYFMGASVIVVLDGNALNMSPLRGQPDVCFVTSSANLVDALMTRQNSPSRFGSPSDLFHVDSQLTRWRRLLALSHTMNAVSP
jgi:surface carbohydrate biosynthesis protein (TIGR04326 family)